MSCTRRALRRVAVMVAVVAVLALFTSGAARAETPPKPPEFVPGSWTLVILPDTQLYSERWPGLFTLQTHWIVKNKDKYDIRYVLHVGDLTQSCSTREWQRAQDAMSELDGKVPYAIVPGNHDYGPLTARTDALLNKYFPLAKFKSWPTFGGAMNNNTCNTYHLFSAGGTDWIILALEWAPRDETVRWANDVVAKYPRRKAILLTHAYLAQDGTRYDWASKGKSQGWSPRDPEHTANGSLNDGEELWQKLVARNNFALTFNGHVAVLNGVGLLASKNHRGKTTYQMGVDYQDRDLGGEAYLRILEFLPNGKTVHVKSYSPLYDKYLDDPNNRFFRFELEPDMPEKDVAK